MMIIHKPEKGLSDSLVEFRCRIESSQGTKLLWYRIDQTFGDFLTDLCDAPLVALILPAMALGEDISILGKVSERLYYQLSGPYQHVLKQVIPFLNIVNITAEDLQNTAVRSPGVATGFSGGIDSFSVLADHFFSDVPQGFKITHLLYNNVGSHFQRGEQLFEKRYARLKPVAENIGLPFIKVNSNLDSFYPDTKVKNLGFAQTHTLRNASVPLVLQGGIGRFLYSTDYDNKEVYIRPSTEIAHINPITLASISTEAVDMLSVGGEYSRVDKTIKVAEIPESYDSLDVCWMARGDGSNCSKCPKCTRTLLTFEVAGVLTRYANAFNLRTYQKEKVSVLAQIIRNSNPVFLFKPKTNVFTEYDEEIAQFAKSRNYKFPKRTYIIAWLEYLHFPRFVIGFVMNIFHLKDRISNRLAVIKTSIFSKRDK